MIIATDLDGTVCFLEEYPKALRKRFLTGDERRLKIRLYREFREKALLNSNLAKELQGKDFFIITGRRIRFQELTQKWLDKYKIKPMGIFFYDGKVKTRENLIQFKADIINKLKVNTYYEDDEKIVEGLKKLCPKTQILLPNKI